MNDKTVNALIDVLNETGADHVEWSIVTCDEIKITITVEDVHEVN